ncbi:MAG: BufA1 family periplasmic bufferin-type metallophore [Gammaproteobacteria bacterium]
MKDANVLIKSALASVIALGVAGFGAGMTANAQPAKTDSKPPDMTKSVAQNLSMAQQGWVKCYGINATNKNSCRTALVSCGGNAKARDPNAYVLVPAGLCKQIAGGSLKPAHAATQTESKTASKQG